MKDRQEQELQRTVADLGRRAREADLRGDTKTADALCRRINRVVAFYD